MPIGCFVLCAAVVASFGCQSSSNDGSDKNGDGKLCLRIVKAHISKTRGWLENEYIIKSEVVDNDLSGFEVIYLGDIKSVPPESLQSFHLDLDAGCKTVVRELGYQ